MGVIKAVIGLPSSALLVESLFGNLLIVYSSSGACVGVWDTVPGGRMSRVIVLAPEPSGDKGRTAAVLASGRVSISAVVADDIRHLELEWPFRGTISIFLPLQVPVLASTGPKILC